MNHAIRDLISNVIFAEIGAGHDRADEIAGTVLDALDAQGIQLMQWQRAEDVTPIRRFIGWDEKHGVAEAIRFDGGETGLAAFNGHRLTWEPTHVMAKPLPPKDAE